MTKFPNIEKAKQNIRKQLLTDDRVWVVTFSGGKDSTLLLQLVMEVLLELREEGIVVSKKIYIISSDTGVEMPIMEAYSKADERAKILNYCEVSLITEKSNAKLKINKKRGVNNTELETIEEVA